MESMQACRTVLATGNNRQLINTLVKAKLPLGYPAPDNPYFVSKLITLCIAIKI